MPSARSRGTAPGGGTQLVVPRSSVRRPSISSGTRQVTSVRRRPSVTGGSRAGRARDSSHAYRASPDICRQRGATRGPGARPSSAASAWVGLCTLISAPRGPRRTYGSPAGPKTVTVRRSDVASRRMPGTGPGRTLAVTPGAGLGDETSSATTLCSLSARGEPSAWASTAPTPSAEPSPTATNALGTVAPRRVPSHRAVVAEPRCVGRITAPSSAARTGRARRRTAPSPPAR